MSLRDSTTFLQVISTSIGFMPRSVDRVFITLGAALALVDAILFPHLITIFAHIRTLAFLTRSARMPLFVTLYAVTRFPIRVFAQLSTSFIFRTSNRLQVTGVNTRSVEAQMVDGQSGWNWTDACLIGASMRHLVNLLTGCISVLHGKSITTAHFLSRPRPTCFGTVDALKSQESICESHSFHINWYSGFRESRQQ